MIILVWYGTLKHYNSPDGPTTSVQTGLKMFLTQYIIELNHLKTFMFKYLAL